MTGSGKTFIYARMNDGTFPKQIQLGSRSVVWNERDVIDWWSAQNPNT
ncbi:MAG: AlpA family phage regulatory protein [Synechococcus sp. YX04-3]|nr:MAG: AlpA family phage regulatory protein [Synechococcus sp. YX04-3]